MPDPTTSPDDGRRSEQELSLPMESVTLQQAYKRSSLTHADLAVATGLSLGAVRIALAGFRYRDGEARVTRPPDETLAKLASVLGESPHLLRTLGRARAAAMMEKAETVAIDLEAPAAIAGRHALAIQVLGLFSTEELRREIERRDATGYDLEP